MTSRRQLSALITSAFPAAQYKSLLRMPLDWQIGEIRRMRKSLDEWNDSLDTAPGGRNEVDRAYGAWRDRG